MCFRLIVATIVSLAVSVGVQAPSALMVTVSAGIGSQALAVAYTATMRFNLVHVLPEQRAKGPLAYIETIETIQWGLAQLGHVVTTSTNTFVRSARNIVFGVQMMPPE